MGSVRTVMTFVLITILGESAFTQPFSQAIANGKVANEGFRRCMKYTLAWLREADAKTKLIPRNLQTSRDLWNANDAAADNYAFMVLTASMLDTLLFETTMKEMLQNESRLTSRIRSLPDTYSFSKQSFKDDTVDIEQIIFGTAEYMKDGLIPVTEWLGQSPWSDRLLGMLDDLHQEVEVVKSIQRRYFGNSPVVEINGDLLQVLCRMYWFAGKEEYLQWAIKIGDYYLLEGNLPTNAAYLRMRDHGCEIIAGLSELYVTLHFADHEKKERYRSSMHEMLDKILEIGRNEDGLSYNAVNPTTGIIVDSALADTWGYILNSYYAVYLVDKNREYRQAVLWALGNLSKYTDYPWEGTSSDGYADAIESALNLYNRAPHPAVERWMDSEIKVLWSKQLPTGIIEGWHGDGNFARTTLMYCLWKTQGTLVHPWRENIYYGAVKEGNAVTISVSSDSLWTGRLIFDTARHKQIMKMPIDYPRINQFPEWFTVDSGKKYRIKDLVNRSEKIYSGRELREGLVLTVMPRDQIRLEITTLQ